MKKSKSEVKPTAKKKEVVTTPFERMNFIIMLAGLAFIAIGFLLMIGGGADSPSEFSEEIFNARRLIVAPLLILAGYVIEIFAIMYRPKSSKTAENPPQS